MALIYESLILIVEDEILIALDIVNILESKGFKNLKVANNFEDAKKFWTKNQVHLAILDIHLEQKNQGIKLGNLMHQDKKNPFIYLTSHADDSTIDEASLTFPFAYIVKPFSADTLLSNVQLAIKNFNYEKLDFRAKGTIIKSSTPHKLKKAIDYIHHNLETDINVNKLAEILAYERSHFSRMFKKEFGVSPSIYIQEKKIERACALIVDSPLKLTEIAKNLGFETYTSFNSSFQRLVKMSPSEYRHTKLGELQ